MAKCLPSPELLRKLLRYEPDTGELFWRERTPDMFEGGKHTAEHICNKWNAKFSGAVALGAGNGSGYMCGDILGVKHRAHRVIWAMETGAWPVDQIDHINGVRDANRKENLREASCVENNRNRKKPATNTSGTMGVSWHKRDQKWQAHISDDGAMMHLGNFNCFTGAMLARKAAEIKCGYHPNHGRTAT